VSESEGKKRARERKREREIDSIWERDRDIAKERAREK